MDQVIKLPEILAQIASAGIPGLIGAGVLLVVFIAIWMMYNKWKKDELAKQEEKDRLKDQASNPTENSDADQAAEQSEQDIEEIINGQ